MRGWRPGKVVHPVGLRLCCVVRGCEEALQVCVQGHRGGAGGVAARAQLEGQATGGNAAVRSVVKAGQTDSGRAVECLK